MIGTCTYGRLSFISTTVKLINNNYNLFHLLKVSIRGLNYQKEYFISYLPFYIYLCLPSSISIIQDRNCTNKNYSL